MGFFKKKKHNLIEEDAIENVEVAVAMDDDTDDFDAIPAPEETVTREDFHKMAEESLQEAIDEGITQVVDTDEEDSEETSPAESDSANEIESDTEIVNEEAETDNEDDADESESESDANEEDESDDDADSNDDEEDESDDDDKSEDDEDNESDDESEDGEDDESISDDGDDFDVLPGNSPQTNDANENSNSEPKPKKEKKPRMTFAEFCNKYRKAIYAVVITFCALFVACLGLYIYGCATVPENVMGRNIYIEDVNVSGLTYEDALDKVKSTSLLDNCDITVTCKGVNYTISGIDVGLTARIEDTVDKAMRYGKTGNVLIDGLANALQVVKKHTVVPSANVSEKTLRQKLSEFGNIVYGELVEHQLEIGDRKVICTPGHTGFSGDTDEAYKQVIKAIENEKFSKIRVSLKSAHPKTLTLEDIDAFTYTNPQDAHFDITDNNVTVVPEVWGRHLDLEAVRPLVSQIYEGGNVVYIPFSTSEPKIKAKDLEGKLFNATLGSFYTFYGGSTANRAANVSNAASKINGKVLAPGEVFSFNDTVGKRSVANGFHTAPEYANGQTVMGIGGGTCQVSSTLYNAVLYSDLSIVYRLNHMFAVGYCPLGQDATVSDSGVDFKFSNNTDYPVKISAVTSGGKITVSILGTQRDVPHTVKIENYTSYSGANRSVQSYRTVYDPEGKLIRKEDLGNSYYMSH